MGVKDIFSFVNQVNNALNAEQKVKLAQIADAYFESVDNNYLLRERIDKLEREIRSKEDEIIKLNNLIEHMQKLKHSEKGYFYTEEDGSEIGPICPKCYSRDNVIQPLVSSSRGAFCSVCETHYQGIETSKEGYKPVVG